MSIETEEDEKTLKEYNDEQLAKLARAYRAWERERDYYVRLEEEFYDLSKLDIIKAYIELQEKLEYTGFDGDYSDSKVVSNALGEVCLSRTDDDIYVYMGKYFTYSSENLVTRYRSLQASWNFGEDDVTFDDDDLALNFEKTHTIIHPPLDDHSEFNLYQKYFKELRIKYYETLLESSKENADKMIAQYVKKR